MSAIIIGIIIILILVLIGWTWISLGNIEKNRKILYIICGIFITWIITYIIYNVSKMGITYENQEIMKRIRKVFVLVFTIVNGYILLPYSFNILEKIKNAEIGKEKVQKKIIIILVVFIIIAIFESKYLSNAQLETLQIMSLK